MRELDYPTAEQVILDLFADRDVKRISTGELANAALGEYCPTTAAAREVLKIMTREGLLKKRRGKQGWEYCLPHPTKQ